MRSAAIRRTVYGALFLLIVLVEVFIGLYVRDSFWRPYGGDLLVVIALCCAVRTVRPRGTKFLALFVFLFAAVVELAQSVDYVSLFGLGHISFFRILMGTSFSFYDLLAYGGGCALFFIGENIALRFLKEESE